MVNVSCDDEYEDGTDDCRNDDRPEFGGYHVEIKHKCHAGRDEKETEVAHQKIGESLYPFEFYPARLQEGREQQHADDAARQLDTRKPYDELA